nr:hypothetical protein [Tanacetum cinerariifolium]
MKHPLPYRHVVPTTVLIRYRLVPLTAARHVTSALPQTKVQHQRTTKHSVTKAHSPIRRPINLRPSATNSNFHQQVTTVKASQVNVVQGVKENKVTRQRPAKPIVTKPHSPPRRHINRSPSPKDNNFPPKVTAVKNTDAAVFEVKEPESEVHVSSCSSDKTKKHDKQTTREIKGKSLVELYTGVRDLSDDFEEFSDNITNMVNAASAPVTAVGQNSTNNTNNFGAVGPSNIAVSLNFKLGGKYSYVDPSQYPDDPDMPALEDITYSDNEENVGAEADFSNLETNIHVSLIPTTRVHKDHPVTQIIGACFVSQEKPKRVHQALKDSSWIEAMLEELLQFKMQKEEGIDYEEVFAPVARIEAIWLFLAYA